MTDLTHIRLSEVDSTNNYLRALASDHGADNVLVTADYQTAGRGSATNTWESESGRNILMSLLTHPTHIRPAHQFLLTECISLAIRDALSGFAEGFTIKWPNDIYNKDKKVVGILIENRLTASHIQDCIMGIGINVNQSRFTSPAPNPASLVQITGHEHDRDAIIARILSLYHHYLTFTLDGREAQLHDCYLAHLYRRGVEADYEDALGPFRATLTTVLPSGHLVLTDIAGRERRYEFKGVKFK